MFLFNNYLITIYLPIFFAFCGLILLSVISKNNFYYWFFGASFISFIFFFLGITKFGFEPTTFYGRPRVHFGFIHPVQTSSIIIGAFSFLVLLTNRIKNKKILKTSTQILIYILFAFFLFLAQSSNLFIGFHIVILLFFIFKWKNLFVFKKFILIFLLSAPFLTLLLFNLPIKSLELLDDFTSGRLLNYKQLIFENLANENVFTILIGPTKYLKFLILNNDVTGFASRDSVYLSFLLSFGLLGLFALIIFLFIIGNKLIKVNDKSFSIFCGVIFFYIADAQGLTPNNLIIYSGLAFALNQYINRDKLIDRL
jgi:O-antigen ligase